MKLPDLPELAGVIIPGNIAHSCSSNSFVLGQYIYTNGDIRTYGRQCAIEALEAAFWEITADYAKHGKHNPLEVIRALKDKL
jgi:hypothetical protein